VMMPKRNGFEVCRVIKDDPATAATTVILLTAKGQAYDREQGMDAGADQYLTKPFDPDDLLQRARDALRLDGAAG
jgi:two-component system alkaline phosphatase synthesis response regulator PhoP